MLLPDNSLDEIVAGGFGEDLVVRRTNLADSSKSTWAKLEGSRTGYRPGTGDVTALSVLDREAYPEIVAGRANGDLSIYAVHGDAILSEPVQLIARGESHYTQPIELVSSSIKSHAYNAVMWTVWQPSTKILAACQGSCLRLYDLSVPPWNSKAGINPITVCDVSGKDSGLLIRNAAFLSTDTIACGLGDSEYALRWGHVRPTGIELHSAAHNTKMDHILSVRTEALADGKLTVRAIEPVSGYRGNSMLLSAWDDGTIR
jgi:hypothetical protein